MTRVRLTTAWALIGALVGLLLSAVLTAPRGADHHCPAGSSVDACTYPPNLALWRAEWIAGGLVGGVLIGLVVWFAVAALAHADGRDRFPHRV